MSLALVAPEQTDAGILGRIRDGDTAGFGVLYARDVGAARRLAGSIVRDRSKVDDIVSEVFAASFAAIRRGKGPVDAFLPYVLSSIRYECWRSCRRADRTRQTSVESDVVASLAGPVGMPDDFSRLDENEVLQQAFDGLSPRMRAVLWHTEVDGLSHGEVARLIGSSSQAVAALAMRARRELSERYLQAHLSATAAPTDRECREIRRSLAEVVRGTASTRLRRRVTAHLADCAACDHAHQQLGHVNQRLRTLSLPTLIGATTLPKLFGVGITARLGAWLFGPTAAFTAATGLVLASALSSGAPPAMSPPLQGDSVPTSVVEVGLATVTPIVAQPVERPAGAATSGRVGGLPAVDASTFEPVVVTAPPLGPVGVSGDPSHPVPLAIPVPPSGVPASTSQTAAMAPPTATVEFPVTAGDARIAVTIPLPTVPSIGDATAPVDLGVASADVAVGGPDVVAAEVGAAKLELAITLADVTEPLLGIPVLGD